MRAVVVVVAALLTLAFTAPYATLNQATYLLDPIHRAYPELFHCDWLVSETPPYHPVFGWLVQWLYVLDGDGAIAMLAAHIAVTIASYAAVYWLVSALIPGWRVFAIVAGHVALTRNITIGGSYMFSGYFQPSSLGTLGWLVAMAAFVRGRYMLCGCALAIGGALHVNFLVLGIGLFTLAAVARRDLALVDHVKLLAPQLVVLACFVPFLLRAAGPSDEAVWILTEFHAPLHYLPARLLPWLDQLFVWPLAGIGALYLLRGDQRALALCRFLVIASAIILATTLVSAYTPYIAITQLFWSRMAPFAQLAAQVLIVCALVKHVDDPQPLTRRARILVGISFIVPLWTIYAHVHVMVGLCATAVGSALIVIALAPWPRIARGAVVALAVTLPLFALWRSPHGAGLTRAPAVWRDELGVERWVQAHTHTDALFLAPPSLYKFRLMARRAVVADLKSPPLRPDLLVQWYHRICAMVRLPNARSSREIETHYYELTPDELLEVAHAFSADYIIRPIGPWPKPPVFANATFAVYHVR